MKTAAYVLEMEAQIQQRLRDLGSPETSFGQSSPCPGWQVRFVDRLSTLEARVTSLEAKEEGDFSCGLTCAKQSWASIVQHAQQGLNGSSTSAPSKFSTLFEEPAETKRANIAKEIDDFRNQRQTEGKLAGPVVPDSLVTNEVREFFAKMEELVAIVGPIGESLDQHFREVHDAFDEKLTSLSALMSRQVEVLVDKKFNALRCHKEHMQVLPDGTKSDTMNSERSRHTIASFHRDELAAEAAASAYPVLAHCHRGYDSMSDIHVGLTSPSLPIAPSGPSGRPVPPPAWKPFSSSGLDHVQSVTEGPARAMSRRNLPDARPQAPHSARESSKDRRKHWLLEGREC
mmetsp:Transcript_91028/g.180984  ORF Transcript_91028/g.180984 Transcript_91028/m.180984 type:complete len:344 (+) Transcript_91028:110-1141(+)